MSVTVHNTGKLTPVPIVDSLENTARMILKEMGVKPKDYYNSFLEQLEDFGDEQYLIIGDIIYTVEMTSNDPYGDIFKAQKNDDGTINFEVKYHNGGCGFGEAIEQALKDNLTP